MIKKIQQFKKYLLDSNIQRLEEKDNLTEQEAEELSRMKHYRWREYEK